MTCTWPSSTVSVPGHLCYVTSFLEPFVARCPRRKGISRRRKMRQSRNAHCAPLWGLVTQGAAESLAALPARPSVHAVSSIAAGVLAHPALPLGGAVPALIGAAAQRAPGGNVASPNPAGGLSRSPSWVSGIWGLVRKGNVGSSELYLLVWIVLPFPGERYVPHYVGVCASRCAPLWWLRRLRRAPGRRHP